MTVHDRSEDRVRSEPVKEPRIESKHPASYGSEVRVSIPDKPRSFATYATEQQIPCAVRVCLDRATFTLLSGVNAGQVFPLDRADHLIGRSADTTVWLQDPDVSRHHARVTRNEDGTYVIEDLRSTNGVFVGGRKVDRCELRSGDRVHIGSKHVLRFDLTDEADRELQQRLYESARRDPLTKAFNRAHFVERLAGEVAYSRRHGTELALLMLDIDHFKRINDAHGHLAGDAALRSVAAEIARIIRTEDVFARYGGEEFVLLTRSIVAANAMWLGERVRLAVEQLPIDAEAVTLRATLSVGVACFTEIAANAGPQELIGLADKRLYEAKSSGRNRVCGP